MSQAPERMRAKCLCIDIETSRQDSMTLREIGVYRPDTDTRARIHGKASDLTCPASTILAELTTITLAGIS